MENKTSTHSDRLVEWTLEAIQRFKHTNNSISRAVDFWLNSLLDGFVSEFSIETLKAYNEVERYFFKGYRGKYPKSLNLWIKMLLCEQGILRLDGESS